jgi:ATP-dependent RNA helicase DDX35
MEDEVLSSSYKPPSLLPIARYKESLLYTIETYPVTIVVGATGSGKTTQLPQFLYQSGWCSNDQCIAITQPRRVAVTSVATRVAEEMNCEIGQEVGYSIRFEDLTSSSTRIKFLTDGMLLREALVDPLLSRYSVIMIDEAHERSISSDVLIGLLKKIRRKRLDLRIIISSATIQAEDFLDYFTREQEGADLEKEVAARIISIEGRSFPIDILFSESPIEDYVTQTVETVLSIHTKESAGDVLVFLPGRNDIETVLQSLNERAGSLQLSSLQVFPLYAGLPTDQQMMVFESPEPGTRKVILSTNIAEASVTIDGIGFVVDTGFVKLKAFNPLTGISALITVPVSKASANQRAGRAGRTSPGKCFRLYTEASYIRLDDSTPPEIQRVDLAPLILQLKALGIDNVAKFEFLTSPPSELVARSLEMLYALGSIDDYAKLTRPLGLRMAELALDPMMSKVLLESLTFGCTNEILTIAAMTSIQGNLWIVHDGSTKPMESSRRKFAAEEGDHLTLLNLYQGFVTKARKDPKWCHQNYINYKSMTRALSIRSQLKRALERFGITVEDWSSSLSKPVAGNIERSEAICRCLTSGYFAHAARMSPNGSFKSVSGATFYAHPTSLMFNRKADWVIFHEIMEIGNKVYIRDITKVEKSWLLEYASKYYQSN